MSLVTSLPGSLRAKQVSTNPNFAAVIVEMALQDRIKLKPFVERRPMSSINQTFEDLHEGRASRRVILVPE